MTTIATDGRTMAGDGRSCADQRICSDRTVKVVKAGDGILGLSGKTAARGKVAAWLDREGPFPGDSDWQALHLTGDGLTLYSSKGGGDGTAVQPPFAVGSGAGIAIGAMLAGASPKRAVEFAAKIDPFTGGDVTVVTL